MNQVRKENFNKPQFASNSFIQELQEWQSLCWDIDDLEMPSRNDMDPYTGEVAEDYMTTMTELREKSETIRDKALNLQQ